jgi:hypothetical protein
LSVAIHLLPIVLIVRRKILLVVVGPTATHAVPQLLSPAAATLFPSFLLLLLLLLMLLVMGVVRRGRLLSLLARGPALLCELAGPTTSHTELTRRLVHPATGGAFEPEQRILNQLVETQYGHTKPVQLVLSAFERNPPPQIRTDGLLNLHGGEALLLKLLLSGRNANKLNWTKHF